MRVLLSQPSEGDIEVLLAAERQSLGLQELDPQSPFAVRLNPRLLLGQENWDDYVERCNKYLNGYKQWLIESAELRLKERREFRFNIRVANIGTNVGEDVDVCLAFPPVLQSLEDSEKEAAARQRNLPEQPKRPAPFDHFGLSSLSSLNRMQPQPIPVMRGGWSEIYKRFPGPGDPRLEISGTHEAGFVIRMFLKKLNHHKQFEFGPFSACFSDWEHASPFEVSLTVIAANMVEKIETKIPVIVEIKKEKQ